MKITDLNVYPVQSHLETALGSMSANWLFVVLETDEGISGIGECTNSPRDGNILVAKALQTIKGTLVGRDPKNIEAIWQELYRNYTYLGSRGLVTTVISGIDIALWDLRGKALGCPIYDLLGGAVRPDIPLYTHPAYGPPAEIAESSCQAVEEGYTALKTDPFHEEMGPYHTARISGVISRQGERRGVEILSAIRDAVGTEVEILIDAHGHYDVASAIRCANVVKPFDITWFEEPVPPESYDALKQVRDAVDVRICVGERLFTRWDFAPVLQNRLADYLMPDVCWTGGITEMKKIAAMAETYFVSVSPHGAMGPLQLLAGAHAMITVPNFYRLETFNLREPIFNAVLDSSVDVRQGRLHLSQRPGLGVELNMDYIRAHPDPRW
jgi:galactonate dehydratase